jgi:hypothetical protein
MYRQKVIGYNNASGMSYLNCGMSQYEKVDKPIDDYETADFENKENTKEMMVLMNDNLDIEKVSKVVQKEEEIDLELKADPSKGTDPLYRIDKSELFPVKISVDVMKNNYAVGRKIPNLDKMDKSYNRKTKEMMKYYN